MKNVTLKKIVYFILFILFTLWIERINFIWLGFNATPTRQIFNIAFILMVASLLLVIPNPEVQFWFEVGLLSFQILISALNINLIKTNGELFFWDMLALFEEGRQAAQVEELTLKFLTGYIFVMLFFIAIRFGLLYLLKIINKTYIPKNISKLKNLVISFVAFAVVLFSGIIINSVSYNKLIKSVENATQAEILLSDANLYQTFYQPELALKTFGSYTYYIKGLSYYFGTETGSEALLTMIDQYLSSGVPETNEFTGISEGNNVIVMLLESFEFFAIHEDLTPNLYKLFYQDGLLLTHYYGKTKTDMAEGLSIMGSYPATGSIYTGFSQNVYPQSLPNMIRNNTDISLIKSYHNNEGSFFNRTVAHPRFGFDELIDVTQMPGVKQTKFWVNSDYEMLLDKVEDMIPGDNTPFFTYITTFVMHGGYQRRAAFQEYYDHFDEIGFYPEDEAFDKAMRTYIAAAMDLDRAIGLLFERLEETGHLDDTTIFFFGDHNAYYSNLSYIMSGIKKEYVTLIEQYHFPAVIYDTKMKAKANQLGIEVIDKFTTAADVTPTILNLLGIEYNPLEYVGYDVFSPVETVLISKLGGIFNHLFYSTDGIETWSNVETTTEEELAKFHESVLSTMLRTQFTQLIYQVNYYSLDRYRDDPSPSS